MTQEAWSWIGIKVKHEDGRTGAISTEQKSFDCTALTISIDGGGTADVQLNIDGPDTGVAGWSWFDDRADEKEAWQLLGTF